MTIKKIIPVGATWKAQGSHGEQAVIMLRRRDRGFETWYWSYSYKDGSGFELGWGPSYRACVDSVYYRIYDPKIQKAPRFKRVKGT